MENIVIVGSSGHAKVVIDVVEKQGKYNIIGLIESYRAVGEETCGYAVVGAENDLPLLYDKYDLQGLFVAIGDNFARSMVVDKINKILPNVNFIRAIHPCAVLGKDVVIGEGTLLVAGVVVNSCSKVGSFCILNTNSSLDHDSVMHNFSSLAPNSVTGGDCEIGKYSAISIGATIIHGVSIGEHAVIGAGATVFRDIDSYSIAYGLPARTVRKRNPGEKYL